MTDDQRADSAWARCLATASSAPPRTVIYVYSTVATTVFTCEARSAIIGEYGRPNPWYHKGNVCGWRSSCSPLWKDFKKMCYQGGQKTVDYGLAGPVEGYRDCGVVWRLGVFGRLQAKRNACLRTQSFGTAGNQIITRYFNEIGLSCNMNKSKGSHVVVFTVEGSRMLFKMVAPFVHPTMYDKLLKG
jgi:hypothetical protein